MKPSSPAPVDWRPRFALIWSGQLFSLLGSSIVQFALVWWLTKRTGAATTLTTAMLVAVLPQVVLGPLVGALIDRHNRQRIMILADSLVALVAVWLLWLFWSGSVQVWHLYVASFLRAVGGGLHWPAMAASTTLLVPERHLTRVAGLNHAVQGALSILGPPLGAWLVELWPMHWIMGLDIGTAALAVLPLLLVRIPQPAQTALGPTTFGALWGDVREGLRFFWGWRALRWVLVGGLLLNFVLGPAAALSPLLITQHFGGGATELGWFQSAWATGITAGGLLLGVWGGFRRKMLTALSGLALMGLSLVVVGGLPAAALLWASLANGLAGLTLPLVNGPLHALLQARVPAQMQGRVLTVVASLGTAMMPVGLVLAGPLGDVISVRAWFIAGGLTCTVLALAGTLSPLVRGIDQSAPSRCATDPLPATVN